MVNRIGILKKTIFISSVLLIVSLFGGLLLSFMSTQNASAADITCGKQETFLGFKYWHNGIDQNADCSIIMPTGDDNIKNFVLQIAMNILDTVFLATAYIAFFFILYGGFQFIISQGSADKMASARNTIMNAAIGLVIAVSAVAIVRFVLDSLLLGAVDTSKDLKVVDVMNGLLNLFYFASGAVAMIIMIISGFTMVSVGSKADSVAKARNSIMYAAIGFVVIVAAKGITFFIMGRF